MENLIIGFLCGVVVFGIIWQFFLKNKKDENKIDDTEIKIDLARKEEELKAAEKAKDSLQEQLTKKETEVTKLYKVADGINVLKIMHITKWQYATHLSLRLP